MDLQSKQFAAVSVIEAMHARFETNSQEFNKIEAIRPDEDDYAERGRIDRAMAASMAEADALRIAIISQIPDGWKDALILQFHIRLEHDFQANAAKPVEEQRKELLATAIDTVFDFMACEIDADHAAIGPQMQDACNRVFVARRYRTGVMEG